MTNFKNYLLEQSGLKEVDLRTDKEILRFSIKLELEATNSYEFLADKAKNRHVKKVLLDIAKEEKTHIHEFEKLLSMLDKEYTEEEEHAEKELDDMGIKQ